MPDTNTAESGMLKGESRRIQLLLDFDVYLALKAVAAREGRLLGSVASDAMRKGLPQVVILQEAQ